MAKTQEEIVQPEAYFLPKGKFVPNNRLPALVYRNVLYRPVTRESAQALCEGNHWEKRVSYDRFAVIFRPSTLVHAISTLVNFLFPLDYL
jgi:hypothetical protein